MMKQWMMCAACFFAGSVLTTISSSAGEEQKEKTVAEQKVGIARIWHGKTAADKTEEYTKYLTESGITKLRSIKGNLGVQLLRQKGDKTTEYYVISYWPSREEIRAYAGADIEKTRNLPRDHEYLIDMEPNVRHFNVIENQWTAKESK